jgi:hypothetical protein
MNVTYNFNFGTSNGSIGPAVTGQLSLNHAPVSVFAFRFFVRVCVCVFL